MFATKKKIGFSWTLWQTQHKPNHRGFHWLLVLVGVLLASTGNLYLSGLAWGLTEEFDASRSRENLDPLREAIAQPSNDAEAYYQQGNTYLEQQDYDRAIAEYSRAIELDPTHIYAYDNLAKTYRQLSDLYFDRGEPDRGLATYDKAIEVNGNEFRQGSVTCRQNEADQREIAILTTEFATIFCNSNVFHYWDDVTGEMIFSGEYYYVGQSRQTGEIKEISNATRSIDEAKRIITFKVTEGQYTYQIETNEGLNTNYIVRNEQRYFSEEPCWRAFSIFQDGQQIYHQMVDGCPN
ncbi:MAG: tetratricopeptide repeat protein [Oscillatoria sp. PMC 1068.18]|nr:tetratricopeptide repeat protein [Oscillatoria sp. PMC 1076.18]MEC4989725.1 tetratricopeptide repeat protein [Oscillatoria sp. PMC 1068.18]